MARIKTKRSIHLAQLEGYSSHSQPAQLMPIKVHVYRTIAELNAGFENVIRDLKAIQQVGFLRSERLAEMHDLVCWIRAQVNQDFLNILTVREKSNAEHFEQLRGRIAALNLSPFR